MNVYCGQVLAEVQHTQSRPENKPPPPQTIKPQPISSKCRNIWGFLLGRGLGRGESRDPIPYLILVPACPTAVIRPVQEVSAQT